MSAAAAANSNPIEWALRVCQSTAFAIHGVLGIAEPFTGCVQGAFRDLHGGMPNWFWPVAGVLLWTVAVLNFSSRDAVILAAQAYICAFHMGGFFYHVRLGHHPAVGLAPAVFAVLAVVVVAIRTSSPLAALLGWVACTGVAYGLSRILVKPPPATGNEPLLQPQ
mmetsp:Transcript_28546/g.84034  ORF Transcript_28546/g.84034 Transcript_28546/m.84034 type:complete len:165 (-) Transcript_28546:847-1341(-)|eukprot:CAMPEP_0113554630 /NCGR_PEP_ID=MMETSP0015_2-20120614/16260_1 /TAXON_ID=2838 /ORGANISM="Odontella" /LENGTH=164 /DNA_ID=CAMNT_0000455801 /DNA_START=97 /DNA_END=591 /DNA_ORIENTATION=- /assembly_acc=CAM_ASM_000160